MKRYIAVIMIVGVLLGMLGCQKSDTATPEMGNFYQNGLLVQNSAVTMTVHTDGVESPVYQLDFTVYNHTDYTIVYEREKRIVERYRGGGWQVMYDLGAPSYTGQIPSKIETPALDAKQIATHTIYFAKSFADVPDTKELIYARTYLPLEPDTYRIRLPGCRLEGLPEGVSGQTFEVIGYFTIYP